MNFKIGQKVWCTVKRPDLGVVGEHAGVVVGIAQQAHGDYVCEIPGAPCPRSHPDYPKGAWVAWSRGLRPRDEPDDGVDYDFGLSDIAPNTRVAWGAGPWRPSPVLQSIMRGLDGIG